MCYGTAVEEEKSGEEARGGEAEKKAQAKGEWCG